MAKITQEEFEKRIFDIYGDKFIVVGKYKDCKTKIDIKCNICETIFSRNPNSMTSAKKCTCPICHPTQATLDVIKGVNDLATTHPDVAKLLANPNDGFIMRYGTKKKLEFICPECGNHGMSLPYEVATRGYSCKFCGDKISYPNKFMGNLLDMKKIPFDTEYIITPYPFRYDFKFDLNGKKYLIEMDGAYGHGITNTNTRTIEQQIFDDLEKDRIAKENDFILIRVDCKYRNLSERFSYVVDSLNKTILRTLFSYTHEELQEIDRKCQKSMVSIIAEKWNEGIRSYDEFETILHIKRPSARRYLKQACALGLISISYENLLQEIRLTSNQKITKSKGMRIKCNETGEIFDSIAQAEKITGFWIRSYFCQNRAYAGQLPDGTRCTWSKVS